jgi:hypothetical protein
MQNVDQEKMMTDRFIDAPECDTEPYSFTTSDGVVINVDSITQEAICVNIGDKDAMLPLGHTYRLNNVIVYRDWPTPQDVVDCLNQVMHAE